MWKIVYMCVHVCECSHLLNRIQVFATPWTGWSPPGSSTHGIFQRRIQEWHPISYSRYLPNPGIETTSLASPALAGWFFTTGTTWKVYTYVCMYMEKAMTTHSSTLAWKIPWTEEPGRLQSMGSQRVRHDWATSLSLITFMHWRTKWQPTPVFLPGEIPGTGVPVGLPSMGSHRVRHDWSDLATQ